MKRVYCDKCEKVLDKHNLNRLAVDDADGTNVYEMRFDFCNDCLHNIKKFMENKK